MMRCDAMRWGGMGLKLDSEMNKESEQRAHECWKYSYGVLFCTLEEVLRESEKSE